ncbi:hypothetical protein ACIP5Y_03420 [Nocardia sp. NPDC088792]|uniref:hypothetical protein n=1 Tax=Nocardia sp. NPDC088792 TaxID=3364332 RepID=UPI0038044ABA
MITKNRAVRTGLATLALSAAGLLGAAGTAAAEIPLTPANGPADIATTPGTGSSNLLTSPIPGNNPGGLSPGGLLTSLSSGSLPAGL